MSVGIMAEAVEPSAMYQHFVPQFLLRNFSHPYVDPESKPAKRRKTSKRVGEKLFHGDAVVHSAALSRNPIELVEAPVKRILGQMNMYSDTRQPPPKQHHVEAMLSQMESRVSTTFRRIVRAFEAGDAGLFLTRKERNDLRKFLFILKYRGLGYHQRFDQPTPEDYSSDDKELFLEYISERGFARPIDVWFDNLTAIMELDMDAAEKWIDKIRKRIYRLDAEMFIQHTQGSYMAICTPENPSDEFIITDNCYNVFEGRSSFATDATTGEVDPTNYISLHEFAPISPKLMLVLRSFMFPVPEEDAHPTIKGIRERCRTAAVDNIFGLETLQNSLLYRLPVRKARNSYSTFVNGKTTLIEGEDGIHTPRDRFCFSFFPIAREYIYRINGIFIDNAPTCTNAVFASRENFLKSLEWYMTANPDTIGKNVGVTDGCQRLQLLKKLDTLMKAMGSDRTSVWDETPIEGLYHRDFDRTWRTHLFRELHRLQDDPSQPLDPFMAAYTILGGSAIAFWDDFDQAKRMWTLRVKIDSWSKGVEENIRRRNRDLLIGAYQRCPPWRLLIYMKIVRFFHLNWEDSKQSGLNPRELGGSQEGVQEETEDVVAYARLLVDNKTDINHILYVTVTNEIEMKKRLVVDKGQILDFMAGELAQLIVRAFARPGPICCCGIPEIEQLAIATLEQSREIHSAMTDGLDITLRGRDFGIEILTRMMLREGFTAALEGKMKMTALVKLRDVFFEYTYPTPPKTALRDMLGLISWL